MNKTIHMGVLLQALTALQLAQQAMVRCSVDGYLDVLRARVALQIALGHMGEIAIDSDEVDA